MYCNYIWDTKWTKLKSNYSGQRTLFFTHFKASVIFIDFISDNFNLVTSYFWELLFKGFSWVWIFRTKSCMQIVGKRERWKAVGEMWILGIKLSQWQLIVWYRVLMGLFDFTSGSQRGIWWFEPVMWSEGEEWRCKTDLQT